MKIVIGADHAGYEVKKELVELLKKENIDVIDVGSFDEKPVDYPTIALYAVTKYKLSYIDFGILLCGTGIGMSMAANAYGIRAARCCCMEDVKMAREHNNAEFLCLGVRQKLKVDDIKKMVTKFIYSKFSNDVRHTRRIILMG